MAGSNVLRSKLIRAVNQAAELEVLIAHHTRIGRAAGFIFVGKILNHLGLKLLCFINQVIRNSQFVAHRPRIGNRLRPAAFILGARNTILRPKFKRDSDNVVALIEQKRCRCRGIDASAHANNNARSGFN